MQPVAMAFANRVIATFPDAKVSPMIPDPTTAINSNAVPRPSDSSLAVMKLLLYL
jgi:hypothetical protein